MHINIDQIIEGEIETIAFGGEGILRHNHFVVFVPFTAIGDRISCKIKEVKSSFAKAELVELIKKSDGRANPLCPYFGSCGGCQLQHLQPVPQLNYKLSAVQDALKRIGHLSPPSISIIPAGENWGYRRHITLHLKPKDKGFQAGYIALDNLSLIVIQECPIFIRSDVLILEMVQKWIKEIPNPERIEGRLTILKNQHQQFILSFQFETQFSAELKFFENLLKQSTDLAGIMIQTSIKETIFGNPYCEEIIEGLTFRYSPKIFVQNHPGQSLNIYNQICQLVDQSKQHQVLDLYCGFGITSLLLAKRGHTVTGIECNKEAIVFGQANATFNKLKNNHFIQGDVEKILPKWLKTNCAEIIIVNPPRQGLTKKVIEQLLTSSAQSMIYISCMPATLARDLNLLAKEYYIADGQAYDMFPQTAHVETLIHLKRKN